MHIRNSIISGNIRKYAHKELHIRNLRISGNISVKTSKKSQRYSFLKENFQMFPQ